LDTWVTSDHHFGHRAIERLAGRPPTAWGEMKTLWRERVADDDLVLHLGDFSYRVGRAETRRVAEGLPGRKMLLLGNHDKLGEDFYGSIGFEVLGRGPVIWDRLDPLGRVVCFSHEPDSKYGPGGEMVGGWDVNVHGHLHNHPYWRDVPMLDYRNVSVEVTRYGPVRLGTVLDATWPSRMYQREGAQPWSSPASSAGGPEGGSGLPSRSSSTWASTEPS